MSCTQGDAQIEIVDLSIDGTRDTSLHVLTDTDQHHVMDASIKHQSYGRRNFLPHVSQQEYDDEYLSKTQAIATNHKTAQWHFTALLQCLDEARQNQTEAIALLNEIRQKAEADGLEMDIGYALEYDKTTIAQEHIDLYLQLVGLVGGYQDACGGHLQKTFSRLSHKNDGNLSRNPGDYQHTRASEAEDTIVSVPAAEPSVESIPNATDQSIRRPESFGRSSLPTKRSQDEPKEHAAKRVKATPLLEDESPRIIERNTAHPGSLKFRIRKPR